MSELYENWNKQPIKSMLQQRINTKKRENKIDKNTKLTEKQLMLEYYKFWLETENNESKLLKLLNHPLLTTEDHQKIDEIFDEQKYKQLKIGATMTVFGCGFYWLFLSRKQSFYNFFNNRKSNRVWNFTKKVIGIYSMYLGNLIILNLQFKNAVPVRLNELGMFKKYKLNYEKRVY